METSRSDRRRARPLPLPTTFGGIAAIACGPRRRLLGWLLATAAGAAGIFVWSLELTWGRALEHAVAMWPDDIEIRDGKLVWNGPAPMTLPSGSYLGIVIDPAGRRELGLAADFAVSIESEAIAMKSIFGWMEVRYPAGLNVPLGRLELAGLVAAWRVPFLAGLGVLILVGLLISWSVLASVYAVVLWVAVRLLRGRLGLGEAWRIAVAAFIPGALLITAAIALYATRQLGFIGLLMAWPGHIAVGWLFCAGGVKALITRRSAGTNPFGNVQSLGKKGRPGADNPFGSDR